ncbi:response regulator transcription factor [Flavobacterium sp. DG1-102-2]|uniref:response regulator transcription factor n=1 Tax=Flavobacterium sp. DG1-102-2 TaxID=3081663 RepID=UPI00294A1DE2|nr:response regulator transcription factor [Flavobacterium sp. DG1-102-2]MDV6166889.1 response regulator transcription factor [Flavobacterium sp. DG1-102-2]
MADTIKIALADDEVLFRKGIAFLLQRKKNIDIVFEASDGQELISFLRENRDNGSNPDIIIIDLKMPVTNGVEATKIIHAEFPDIRVIALSSYNTKSFIANMIDVGAASYLVKNTTPQELMTTISEVYENGFYYNDEVLQVIHEYLISPKKKVKRLLEEQLTNREVEVLQLICKQHSGAEIAEKLFLSARTVEGHRNNLLRKTECKNMIGLIIYAINNEYVSLESLID